MDPLSVSASAAALITICLQAVRLIKTTVETLKNAKTLLLSLLNQTERKRLFLEQLRSLTHRLGDRQDLALSFNDRACKATVSELQMLVQRIGRSKTWVSLQVLLNQSKSNDLLQRLKRHEEEIVTVLMFIATQSSLRTEEEVSKMNKKLATQAEVTSAFEPLPKYSLETSMGDCKNRLREYLWAGQTSRFLFDPLYLQRRDALTNAAYLGQWNKVFDVLEIAEKEYFQSWINCPRLNKDPSRSTGWTALHQAVFMCATEEEIRQLLAFGALRTLRTLWTDAQEFSHPDLTPIEMARELGYSHMFDVLSPVVRHNIPPKTLDSLQQKLHGLIARDLESRDEGKHLWLPELVVLTELELPEMWFPISSPEAKDPMGYVYRLDGRELLVKSSGVDESHGSREYRISEEGVFEIEEAFTFNM